MPHKMLEAVVRPLSPLKDKKYFGIYKVKTVELIFTNKHIDKSQHFL